MQDWPGDRYRVPPVTAAQWVFALALAVVATLIMAFGVFVVWTTMWGNRWYRRRG
jgi:hypothetical protein